MAYEISKAVGVNGTNREPDVITIQNLLNQISPDSGGPSPPLKVDGLCRSKTNGAIQKFQLRHFGWKLADGRVDPEGPTHNKMRLLAPKTDWKSRHFRIRRQTPDDQDAKADEASYFEVLDYVYKRCALYSLSPFEISDAYLNWLRTQQLSFAGSAFTVNLARERAVTQLSGRVAHNSFTSWNHTPWEKDTKGRRHSSMTFFFDPEDGPAETVSAGVPFASERSPLIGQFRFCMELPPQLGRW